MEPHDTSDAALIDGLRAGRTDAFHRLYDEQHAGIYNVCARILGDREEAKDVTQDTFMTAFAEPPAAGSSLRAWLNRVATNACFNRLRSGKPHAGPEGLEGVAAPVDEFARAETVTAVEESLGRLNERYRAVLVLKDLHGLASEEIAEVMEVTRPTADVLVHRARASFKTTFAKVAGDVPAPASLGLVLAPLAVPVGLQVLPPLPAHPVPPHLAHLAHQPHTGGLLSKLATAAGTKIAIGAVATAALIGGGALAVHDAERDQGRAANGASGSSANAATVLSVSSASELRHAVYERACDGRHDPLDHDALHDAGHAEASHAGDHGGETAQHKAGTDSGHGGTASDTHESAASSTSGDTTDHSVVSSGEGEHTSTTAGSAGSDAESSDH
jgi:RNA polymerase sigma-70 factor, ECF subfamily